MDRLPDDAPLPKWVRSFGNADQTLPDYPKVKRMAEIICEAINRLLPDGYETREERGEIALLRHGQLEGAIGVAATYFYSPADEHLPEEYERPDDDQFVREHAEQLLNRVQDWITEDLTWPWPTVQGRRTIMPDYHAELNERILRVWYGTDGVPVTQVVEVRLPDWTTLGQ